MDIASPLVGQWFEWVGGCHSVNLTFLSESSTVRGILTAGLLSQHAPESEGTRYGVFLLILTTLTGIAYDMQYVGCACTYVMCVSVSVCAHVYRRIRTDNHSFSVDLLLYVQLSRIIPTYDSTDGCWCYCCTGPVFSPERRFLTVTYRNTAVELYCLLSANVISSVRLLVDWK